MLANGPTRIFLHVLFSICCCNCSFRFALKRTNTKSSWAPHQSSPSSFERAPPAFDYRLVYFIYAVQLYNRLGEARQTSTSVEEAAPVLRLLNERFVPFRCLAGGRGFERVGRCSTSSLSDTRLYVWTFCGSMDRSGSSLLINDEFTGQFPQQ